MTVHSREAINATAPVHEFLPDSRIEYVWNRLHRELKTLPEDTQFATEVQPAQWVDTRGISTLQPERVVFWAVCGNPQQRWKDKYIKQYAVMDMKDWRSAELEKWRFVGSPDPALVVFRSLAKKLIESHKSWSQLN